MYVVKLPVLGLQRAIFNFWHIQLCIFFNEILARIPPVNWVTFHALCSIFEWARAKMPRKSWDLLYRSCWVGPEILTLCSSPAQLNGAPLSRVNWSALKFEVPPVLEFLHGIVLSPIFGDSILSAEFCSRTFWDLATSNMTLDLSPNLSWDNNNHVLV